LSRPPAATEHVTTFDFGHAAHKLVLGAGPEIVVVDAERWDTKAIKEEVAAIHAAGRSRSSADDAATR
jgi:hypothetical protein